MTVGRPLGLLFGALVLAVVLIAATRFHSQSVEQDALAGLEDVRFSYRTAPLAPGLLTRWANRHQIPVPQTITAVFFETNAAKDNDLAHVKQFTNLQHLYLDGAAITDSGIQQLEDLGKLRTLWLSGTRVTEEAVARLKKRLPELTVYGPEESIQR